MAPAAYRLTPAWVEPGTQPEMTGADVRPCTPLVSADQRPPLYGPLQPATLPCGCTAYVTRADVTNYHLATKTATNAAAASAAEAELPHYFVLDTRRATTDAPPSDRVRTTAKTEVEAGASRVDVSACCAHDDASPQRTQSRCATPTYTQHTKPPDLSYTAMCRSSIDNGR